MQKLNYTSNKTKNIDLYKIISIKIKGVEDYEIMIITEHLQNINKMRT